MSKTLVYLYTSDKAKKKYSAFFPTSKKVIHFGQKPYRDYTRLNDKKSVLIWYIFLTLSPKIEIIFHLQREDIIQDNKA